MKDTLGTLRARIAELEAERVELRENARNLAKFVNCGGAPSFQKCSVDGHSIYGPYITEGGLDGPATCEFHDFTRQIAEWRRRAEVAEAALREIGSCRDGVSKTWPEIDAIVRRVVVQEKANAK